jgi:integrase/recombinase XerD
MRDGLLVSEVRVRGPLAAYAVGFSEFLVGQGYAAGSVRLQMHLVAQLSRWLDAESLDLVGLSELAAERFMAARRARVDRLFRSRQALEPVIGYLRELGVVPAPAAVGPRTPVRSWRSDIAAICWWSGR